MKCVYYWHYDMTVFFVENFCLLHSISVQQFHTKLNVFAVLNPFSFSSIIMQSDSLLTMLTFCTLFDAILFVVNLTFLSVTDEIGAITFA